MDDVQRHTELASAATSYSSFFESCKIISYPIGVSNKKETPEDYYSKIIKKSERKRTECLEIITEENGNFTCSVDLGGWFIVDKEEDGRSNQRWETFEALMMNNSSSFQCNFNSSLIARLEKLQNDN